MTTPGTPDSAVPPVQWARVAPSWMGHRGESLIHERMWACPLELSGGEVGYDGRVHEAGFDSAGRPVVLRRSEPAPSPYGEAEVTEEVETVEYRGREIAVNLSGQTVATTTNDEDSRPLRTVYSGAEEGEETYDYDSAGRLAAIDEAECLWMTVPFYEMWESTGGRLTVEYDDRGPARITDSVGATRWERWDEPWPQLLDRGAGAIRDGVVRVAEAHCRAHGVPPATEVFALTLTCVAQGSLQVSPRLLSGEGPIHMDEDVIDGALDNLLLREAALKQPGDPYRVVLGAAAEQLARHDWRPTLITTDDFVVHIAMHDED